LINLQLSFLPFNKFKAKKLGGAVGACTYIIILSKVVFAFAHYSCPYHTKMNKSLVPECPTIIDVRSFTVPYITALIFFHFLVIKTLVSDPQLGKMLDPDPH
jgi:hypothetical protein